MMLLIHFKVIFSIPSPSNSKLKILYHKYPITKNLTLALSK
jgi:hypothetical protein